MQEWLTAHAHTHTLMCKKPAMFSRERASGHREGERKQLAAGLLPHQTL